MSSDEYYDLAWRAVRNGLNELNYMLVPLGLGPRELEDACARAHGGTTFLELSVGVRFSCVVVALAASLSSQLSSLIAEAAVDPGRCAAFSLIPSAVEGLSYLLDRDLREEGALYRLTHDRLYNAALSAVSVMREQARLLGTLCGNTRPEKL